MVSNAKPFPGVENVAHAEHAGIRKFLPSTILNTRKTIHDAGSTAIVAVGLFRFLLDISSFQSILWHHENLEI